MRPPPAPGSRDPLLRAGAPGLAPAADLATATSIVAAAPSATLDPDQQRVQAAMLRFAADHPDALVRTCAAGHLTGSALVLDATGTRTLVLFHTKLQRWLQPGGHADGDANLAAVAWREATEETGIDGLGVDPVPIDLDIHQVAPPHEPAHAHLDVRFLVVAPVGAVERGNHESEALRWVTLDELGALGVDPGTERLARAGFARFEARGDLAER
jgi:8-oxo-dGTP pyrophosphatase MutT (NUDIX family)